MSASTTALGSVLTSFFNDHLKLRKGLRPNSITSYADAMRLFLQFTAKTAGKKITQLGLDDLDAGAVSSFLNALEGDRKTRFSHATSDWRPSAFSSNTSASDSRIDWGRRRKWPLFRESVLNLRRRSFSNAMRSSRPWLYSRSRDATLSGTALYWYSSTTREPAYKKRRTCA